jgi:hypothetical protein
MLAVWMGTGVIANPPVGSGWISAPRRRRKAVQNDEIERKIAEEAEEQAEIALAELQADDRRRYLSRLDQIVAMQPPPVDFDSRIIAEMARKAVEALLTELEAEFDLYVMRLEAEQDDEESIIALMLAH